MPLLPELKIVRDEPGRHLVLEGEQNSVPRWFFPAVFSFFVLVSQGRNADLVSIGFGMLIAAGIYVLFFLVCWNPLSLTVDASAATVVIVDRNLVNGAERSRTIPFSDLALLTLSSLSPGGRSKGPLTVRVTLKVGSRWRRDRRLTLSFDAVDTLAEVTDFAFRLGTVSGLAYQRVVRSDARQVEIEMSREAAEGFTPTPPIVRRASYDRDEVDPAVRKALAQERVPPFDRSQRFATHAVTVWEPRREVRFERSIRLSLILYLIMSAVAFLAVPAGVVLGFIGHSGLEGKAVLCLVGMLGLAVGYGCWIEARKILPERVSFDWSAERLTISGWVRRREVKLSDVTALELRRVRQFRKGGKNSSGGWRDWCELNARARGEKILLIGTKVFKDDPEAAYRRALPLATELANALDVPRRIVESDGREAS